jgi:hypothetical protein
MRSQKLPAVLALLVLGSVTPASAGGPDTRTVTIQLTPGDAAVAVDGHPRQHPNGSLELKGALGAVFTVEAVVGSSTIVQRVAITDVGAFPAKLVVNGPPPPLTLPLPAPLAVDFEECTQRTWRDSDGIKHYKPHCLFDDALTPPLPAAPRPTPQATGTGSLTIVCAPKCDHIYDNGTDLGPGHVFNRPASAGAHALALSATNGVKKTLVVEVVPDQLREVRISMDPGRGSLATDTPDLPVPAPTSAPTPPRPDDTGFLTLSSYPWTKVSENGRPLCLTPCVKVALSPGRHVLLLDNEESGLQQLVQVTIKSRETTVKSLAFR